MKENQTIDAINYQTIYKLFISVFLIIIFYFKLTYANIKISVIIPTYNRGKIIGNSIKSVLNQTFKNLEIIVVDDGSKDNTKEIVDEFKDERVRYIKLNNNTGAANARNIGIKNAIGQYISFQDSDDIFYPDKLERQLKNIINKNSNLDFCKIKVIFNSSFSYFVPSIKQEKNLFNNSIINELISKGNFISNQAILIKKQFLSKYLFDPNLPRLQDYDLILRMIHRAKISYTKDVLVELHIQKDSITRSNKKLRKAIYILLKKNFNFNPNQKLLFSKYLNRLLKIFIWNTKEIINKR